MARKRIRQNAENSGRITLSSLELEEFDANVGNPSKSILLTMATKQSRSNYLTSDYQLLKTILE